MSKKYGSQIKLIKRPNLFFKKVGVFLLSLIIMCGLFFGGVGIANLLSSKKFTWLNNGKIRINSINYYLLHFGEFDNERESLECAIWTASVGGSAYIYKGEKYIVAGHLYSNIDNIDNVINSFNKDLTYTAQKLQFKTENVDICINNIGDGDKKDINNDIKLINNSLENILKMSEKLDKNVISNVSASSEVNSLKSQVKIARLNMDSINLKYNSEELKKISGYFVTMEDSLDVCTNKLLASENYSNVLKYCACELFFNYYDFCKNFV